MDMIKIITAYLSMIVLFKVLLRGVSFKLIYSRATCSAFFLSPTWDGAVRDSDVAWMRFRGVDFCGGFTRYFNGSPSPSREIRTSRDCS